MINCHIFVVLVVKDVIYLLSTTIYKNKSEKLEIQASHHSL